MIVLSLVEVEDFFLDPDPDAEPDNEPEMEARAV